MTVTARVEKPIELPIWLTRGTKVRLNGHRSVLTVESSGSGVTLLRGSRGGRVTLVENVNGHGIYEIRGWARDEGRVESIEALEV